MIPELPGYHYDEEKGKYFKIMPDCASSTGSKYSKTAIAEAEQQKHELKKRDGHWARQKRQQIQRSMILRLHPLGGMLGLEREHGGHEGHVQSAAAEIWARGLRRHDFIQWPGSGLSDNPRSIRHFVQDPATGAIAYSLDCSTERSYPPNVPYVCVPIEDPYDTPDYVDRVWMDHVKPLSFCPASEISSMSISPSRFVLATALGMQKPPTMHLIPLVDPSTFLTCNETFRQGRRGRLYDQNNPSHHLPGLDGDFARMMKYPKDPIETIWASAASPRVDSTVFAVGDSKGTSIVELVGNGAVDLDGQREWCGNGQAAETVAVDFWTPNLVLSGMRSGKVRLWDIRSKGTNVRFQHPSCISNITAIDDHKVLVAGLEAKMAIYDARFTKGHPQSHCNSSIGLSVPLQVFPSYRSGSYFYPRLGFDVQLGLGLIASATEDKKVQMFSWKSSKPELDVGANGNAYVGGPEFISSTESASVSSHSHLSRPAQPNAGIHRENPVKKLREPTRCLKFVENQRGRAGLSLLGANGTKIDEWAW